MYFILICPEEKVHTTLVLTVVTCPTGFLVLSCVCRNHKKLIMDIFFFHGICFDSVVQPLFYYACLDDH